MQRFVGARKVPQTDADLAERGEGDRETMAGAMRFVQRDAALRQRKRLLVAVLHHRHVRLVAADQREDVVGVDRCGQPLRLAKRAHRFVIAADLGERNARQRVDERELAAIAGGVQGGGRLGDVLADDRHIANLPVALAEVVMGKADGA